MRTVATRLVLLLHPEGVVVEDHPLHLVHSVTVRILIADGPSLLVIDRDQPVPAVRTFHKEPRLSLLQLLEAVASALAGLVIGADEVSRRQQPFLQAIDAERQLIGDRDLSVLITAECIVPVCRGLAVYRGGIGQKSAVVFRLLGIVEQRIAHVADIEACPRQVHLLTRLRIRLDDLDDIAFSPVIHGEVHLVVVGKRVIGPVGLRGFARRDIRVPSHVLPAVLRVAFTDEDRRLLQHERGVVRGHLLQRVGAVGNVIDVQASVGADIHGYGRIVLSGCVADNLVDCSPVRPGAFPHEGEIGMALPAAGLQIHLPLRQGGKDGGAAVLLVKYIGPLVGFRQGKAAPVIVVDEDIRSIRPVEIEDAGRIDAVLPVQALMGLVRAAVLVAEVICHLRPVFLLLAGGLAVGRPACIGRRIAAPHARIGADEAAVRSLLHDLVRHIDLPFQVIPQFVRVGSWRLPRIDRRAGLHVDILKGRQVARTVPRLIRKRLHRTELAEGYGPDLLPGCGALRRTVCIRYLSVDVVGRSQ